MSILSGPEIIRCVETGKPHLIVIDPFDRQQVGSNSYDLRLAPELLTYRVTDETVLDPRKNNPCLRLEIPEEGLVLLPSKLYLGSTIEETYCENLVPWVDGRSSIGRLGLQIHMTAGRGDDGFRGCWTLEMKCVHPIRVYPGMKIAQVSFFSLHGKRQPYQGRYQGTQKATPCRLFLGDEDPGPKPLSKSLLENEEE